MMAVVGTLCFNFQVLLPLFARFTWHGTATTYALLTSAMAVGSLAGALLSARRTARPQPRFLVGSVLVFGVLTVITGLMPGYWAFAALLVPTGAAALVFSVANNTFVQLGVDPQMRGRVMALYFMCFLGGTPVGAPVIGWIGEHLGAPWSLVIGGAVVVVAGVLALVWLPRLGLSGRVDDAARTPRASAVPARAA